MINTIRSLSSLKNSKEWIKRHKNDPYVKRATVNSYRCRSAFKLIEILENLHRTTDFQLLKPGQFVFDCGAAPGSWSQSVNGVCVAIDKLFFAPIPGVLDLSNTDINDFDEIRARLTQRLKSNFSWEMPREKFFDVILSDMAPNISGVAEVDQKKMIQLLSCVLKLSLEYGKPGSSLLVKSFQGNLTSRFIDFLKELYSNERKPIRILKPNASRLESSEIYILAQGLRADAREVYSRKLGLSKCANYKQEKKKQ